MKPAKPLTHRPNPPPGRDTVMSPYQLQAEDAYQKLMHRLHTTTKVDLPRLDSDDVNPNYGGSVVPTLRRGTVAGGDGPILVPDDDDTMLLDATPCPPTMRAVLQWIREGITERLSIAEISTIKQCMKLAFECRAFLERFLKDIPSMGFFREHDPSNVEHRSHARQIATEVDDMLHEFKKAPLPLPRSFYREQPDGKYVAQLESVETGTENWKNRRRVREHGGADSASGHSFSLSGSGQSHRVMSTSRFAGVRGHHLSVSTATQTDECFLNLHGQHVVDSLKDAAASADQLRWEAVQRAKRAEAALLASQAIIASHDNIIDDLRRSLYHEVKHLRTQVALNTCSSPMAALGTRVSFTSEMFGRRPVIENPTSENAQLATSADLSEAVEQFHELERPSSETLMYQLWEERSRRREEHAWRVQCEGFLRKRDIALNVARSELQADPVRVVISVELQSLKRDFHSFRTNVKGQLAAVATFLVSMNEAARQRLLAVNIVDPSTSLERAAALEDLATKLTVLLVPMCHPEFASGFHPWLHQRSPEPMLAYAMATYSSTVVSQLQSVLQHYHVIYLYMMRFALTHFYMPDHRSPQYGRGLIRMAELAVVSPQCPSDVIRSLREAIALDSSYAKKQAHVSFRIKCVTFLQQKRASLGKLTTNSSMARAIQNAMSAKQLNELRSQRLMIVNLRMENARRAFRIWSHSDIPMPGRMNGHTKDPIAITSALERYVAQSGVSVTPEPNSAPLVSLKSEKRKKSGGGTTSDEPAKKIPFFSL